VNLVVIDQDNNQLDDLASLVCDPQFVTFPDPAQPEPPLMQINFTLGNSSSTDMTINAGLAFMCWGVAPPGKQARVNDWNVWNPPAPIVSPATTLAAGETGEKGGITVSITKTQFLALSASAQMVMKDNMLTAYKAGAKPAAGQCAVGPTVMGNPQPRIVNYNAVQAGKNPTILSVTGILSSP
jgi:hypothetical protein